MFNQPFLLFLLDKIPQVEFIEHFSTAVSEIMEQVEIDVARSRLPEGCFKLPDSIFASRVRPRRVKIGAARIHEQIDHLLCLLNVDFSAVLRQTHQPEAEFFNMLAKICHFVPLNIVTVYFLESTSRQEVNKKINIPSLKQFCWIARFTTTKFIPLFSFLSPRSGK